MQSLSHLLKKNYNYILTNWCILEWNMATDNSLLIFILVPLEFD